MGRIGEELWRRARLRLAFLEAELDATHPDDARRRDQLQRCIAEERACVDFSAEMNRKERN